MKACITGGSGFIGQQLVQHLCKQGVSVRLLSRGKSQSAIQQNKLGRNVFEVEQGAKQFALHTARQASNEEYFIADLTHRSASLNGFFDDANVIYHCAGEIKNEAVMLALHVEGTAKLLQAAKAHIESTNRPLHWVQLSSVGAYGPPQGRADIERVVMETTPTAPVGEYEITKTRADEMVMQLASTQPLFTYTIVRPSNVIGKKMPNQSVKSLIRLIQKRLFFYIGSTSAVATYVHVDDVVDALILCGHDTRAYGHIFNLSNDCNMSEIVDAVAKQAGISFTPLCIPERPIRLLATFFSLFGKTPLTQGRIDALMKKTSYPHQKFKETLGFKPRHAIPYSMATLLDDEG